MFRSLTKSTKLFHLKQATKSIRFTTVEMAQKQATDRQEMIDVTLGGITWATASIYCNYLMYLDNVKNNQSNALSEFNMYNFTLSPMFGIMGMIAGGIYPGFTYVVGGITLISGTMTALERWARK